MLITFPYYDPTGKYNESLKRQLLILKSTFSSICLSIVPPTVNENADFVRYLKEQGCLIFHNATGTLHGVHSREALRLAIQNARDDESIFFGFADRILFALETNFRESFLRDLENLQSNACVLIERSQSAWETHPVNFRDIEQMVSRMFEFMHGQRIDLMPCGFIFSRAAAEIILSQSVSASTEVWGEWVLLALKNQIPIKRHAVDWLAWKDPYWERVEPNKLKQIRQASQEETVKRINMNVPAMMMLTEERFRNLEK